MDELLCPLHGLHTGIALLHQLRRQWGSPAAPPALISPAQPQAPTWRPRAVKTEAPLETHRGSGGGGALGARHLLPAELTSLRALKAFVAMSSSSEPCAVRFRMFWKVESEQRGSVASPRGPAQSWAPRGAVAIKGSSPHAALPTASCAQVPPPAS